MDQPDGDRALPDGGGDALDSQSYLAELREGLRFIRAHSVLLSMILIATVGNFLDKPLVTVILPVYAKTF